MSSLKKTVIMLLEAMDESKMSDNANQKLRDVASMSQSDIGLSSMELRALGKRIVQEHNVEMKPEEFESIKSLLDLVARLDR